MKIFRLLLRLIVGGLFFGHGTQKLLGWFGGGGLEGTAQMFEGMGMRPGQRNAVAAGLAEAGGGAGLALGYETPLAAAALSATMATAIHRVHLKNGVWVSSGGYEYNLVLIASVLSLVEDPGPLTLDTLLGHERSGLVWALLAGGLAAAGAAGAHQLATRASAPEPSVQPDGPTP